MIRSCGAVVYRFNQNQLQFLLVRTSSGVYGFPKGRKEGNESDIETAKREILEETNYIVEFEKNFKASITFTLPKHGDLKNMQLFLARVVKSGNHQIDEDEITEVIWLDENKAIERITFDNSKEVLIKAVDYILGNELIFMEF